jgi:hypothetical protein
MAVIMREQEKIAGEKMEEHDVIRARQAARGRVQAVCVSTHRGALNSALI